MSIIAFPMMWHHYTFGLLIVHLALQECKNLFSGASGLDLYRTINMCALVPMERGFQAVLTTCRGKGDDLVSDYQDFCKISLERVENKPQLYRYQILIRILLMLGFKKEYQVCWISTLLNAYLIRNTGKFTNRYLNEVLVQILILISVHVHPYNNHIILIEGS